MDLIATTDGGMAYRDTDYVIIAAPTNYDVKKNNFYTSAVETVISTVISGNIHALLEKTPFLWDIQRVQEKIYCDWIIFSTEFLWESKALWDNLYSNLVIVGCDE